MPVEYAVELEILELEYNPLLAILSSADSRAQSAVLTSVFGPYFRSIFPSFERMEITGYFQGEVGLKFTFNLFFHTPSKASNATIIQALQEGNETKGLAFYTLGGDFNVTRIIQNLPSTTLGTTTAAPPGLF